MSHGASPGAIKAEPNLTPLLDVVLQLIMFFVVCVDFVRTDQINETVVLPVSQSAVPMDKSLTEVVFLNMDKNGKLLVKGRYLDPGKSGTGSPARTGAPAEKEKVNVDTPAKIKAYLLRERERAERRLGGDPAKAADKILVVLRAHKAARYRDVFQVLQLCTEAGYRKWQLRVLSRA
jgi:biopolymer transport protein ExbD